MNKALLAAKPNSATDRQFPVALRLHGTRSWRTADIFPIHF